jgi:hypothetical protein
MSSFQLQVGGKSLRERLPLNMRPPATGTARETTTRDELRTVQEPRGSENLVVYDPFGIARHGSEPEAVSSRFPPPWVPSLDNLDTLGGHCGSDPLRVASDDARSAAEETIFTHRGHFILEII